jgi:hypothetical protein
MKNISLTQYSYRVALETARDVNTFCALANACKGEVFLVGAGMKINAKSLLGTHLARVAWNSLYVQTDFDCYRVFEKYIL